MLDFGDGCDDGNLADDDGCQADCTPSLEIMGSLVRVDPPADLSIGAAEDTDHVIFFVEALGETLTAALPTDVREPGETSAFGALPGTLDAGAVVNSYLFHYDLVGTSPATTQTFTIAFPDEMLAIQATTAALNAGNAAVGLAEVTYPAAAAMESDGADTVELSADRRSVTATMAAGTAVDHIRVLTSSAAG